MDEMQDSDIAIIGMALRVPGALDAETFWSNLADGRESLRTLTEQELLDRGVARSTLADPAYVRAGMPLDDMDQFDPDFFGFSAKEAAILDPQHRQFYEVAWEALERAGHPPARFDGAVGVFAGSGMAAYFAKNILTNPDLVRSVGHFLLRHTGNDKDFLATRVSYAFDLNGPSVNVQTACSTSLVATHLAVQSLLSGETDMALAGGVTIDLPHGVGYEYKEGEILSPDGHCRPFDHRSKGTIFGSGAGVVVLRRLADALDDGDHIHAVIKGTAVNNDGSAKVGYLAPSVEGQAAAIAEALAIAGAEPESIQYVECHGTGTPVGDPIEVSALAEAFGAGEGRTGDCLLGSVKSNIGHLDTAAGVTSLIKTSLALEHGVVPASLNFEAPNPNIPFAQTPFSVAAATTAWPATNGPRRAGVNSLGVGGTNAFAILEAPPVRPQSAADDSPQLIVLSAKSRKALDDASQRMSQWLHDHPECSLPDVAWTLFRGRTPFEHRRVLAASTPVEAAEALEAGNARRVFTHTHELENPSLVFMYPGGGAQYFGMGRGLYATEPVFRDTIDEGLRLLRERFDADLSAIFHAPEDERADTEAALAKPSVQLPLIFLVEYALTRLWAEFGVEPKSLIGHSLGENTAACVSGVFSFEDALGLVLLRGRLMDEVPKGGMLSVPLPADELQPLLGEELDLAAANGPSLSVASGPADRLDALAEQLAADGIDTQRVRIDIAAHSRLLDGITGRFGDYLKSIELRPPSIPMISNRTGDWLTDEQAQDPEYWVEHLRRSVFFAAGASRLLEREDRVFLEVGPGNTLGSLVRQNPGAPASRVFGTLRHPDDPLSDELYWRAVVGRLWAVGVDVDTDRLWPAPRRRVPLPTYAFQHGRYWIEPGAGRVDDTEALIRPERLEDLGDWFHEPRWIQQGVLDVERAPQTWLVFTAGQPELEAVVEQLRGRAHRVVVVRAGDAFARIDAHHYTIAPEAGGLGYEEMLEALAADDLLPTRILHGWLLTHDQNYRPGSTFFHRNQEYGFYSLFHLARAIGRSELADEPLHLIVAANGAQGVAGAGAIYPDKATVLGPSAVLPREFPQLTCRFVDLEAEDPAAKSRRARREADPRARIAGAVSALLEEAQAAPDDAVVAWREGVRWRRHLRAVDEVPGDAPSRLREQGVYLITGGFGGIAGVVAEWLASRYRARLVLLGRTPLPAREAWDAWLARNGRGDRVSQAIERVRTLERLGAEVLVISADVTIEDQMREAAEQIEAEFGALNGVFHTAGTLRDNLVSLKNQREIEEVFSAKVYGTLVLDAVLAEKPLDFMALFSSTSLFVAPPGQVDYVGANAFLNAYASAASNTRAWPVTAINWGIWRDVGMVGAADADTMEKELEHASEQTCSHPLFETRHSALSGTGRIDIFDAKLAPELHWVLDEHRLRSGEALLPGTSYLELVRAAAAEFAPGRQWELEGLVFEDPFFVEDGASRRMRVRVEGSDDARTVSLLAEGDDGSSWSTCATAGLNFRGTTEATTGPFAEIEARFESCEGEQTGGSGSLRTRQEDHLRFGPRWKVLQRLRCASREALAELRLAPEFEGDLDHYQLHPGLLDIATGCAMDLIPGYAEQEVAEDLWVPISYRRFRYFAPLTPQLKSWIRLRDDASTASGFATFDVSLFGQDGSLLAEVEGLTLRRTSGSVLPSAPIDSGTERRQRTPSEIALEHNRAAGITASEGTHALERVLSGDLRRELIVTSLEPSDLLRQTQATAALADQRSETRFERPELDSEFEAPRNEGERTLSDVWGKLLGVEGIGIHDSFFDLGGHSLVAVRLFNEINERFGVDLPMSVLVQHPTIAGLSELLGLDQEETGEALQSEGERKSILEYEYVVPMHVGAVKDETPLFVVAGMFGNVLNLSHLAHLLGEDRPFYAIQARGLYGSQEPHESFEEMARDYLEEVRRVQPTGPYLLGGFSGGGIAAFEMARLLLAAGEDVRTVILLDTPIEAGPQLSLGDKLLMLTQDLRRMGPRVIIDRMRERSAWKAEMDRQASIDAAESDSGEGDRVSFQSARIGDAFRRALDGYRVPEVPVHVDLFRPRLDVRWTLPGGRRVDSERAFVREDNFWTDRVADIAIHEVPGNHDSMVLEPNVRVLVGSVRAAIERALAAGGREAGGALALEPTVRMHDDDMETAERAPLDKTG